MKFIIKYFDSKKKFHFNEIYKTAKYIKSLIAVSYTHLDVYKRQTLTRTDGRGTTTTIRTDLAARAVSVTDAAGNETVTQYDACHDLAAMVTDCLLYTSRCV